MVKFLGLILALCTFQLFASTTHIGTIAHINIGKHKTDKPLLYFSDGYVLKLTGDKEELDSYITAKRASSVLKLVVDKNRNVLSAEELEGKVEEGESYTSNAEYVPSVLNSMDEAKRVFSTLRGGSRRFSQCYNRAHVWAFESKKNLSLNSMKVFMFYTSKYIREFNFDWWFHVSPFTYVNINGVKEERLLDFKFTREPLTVKAWTDIFMRNKVTCPAITKYSDYANHEEEQYCYLLKVSMYYMQPLDLDKLERTGATKSEWIDWEVRNAFRQGFGIFL